MVLRFYAIMGVFVLAFLTIGFAAEIIQNRQVESEIEYSRYKEIDILTPVTVTTPRSCAFNVTADRETCYEATSHTEYIINETIQIPIKRSQINKIKNAAGDFEAVKFDSYSSDGILSIWKVPIGDRNLDEHPRCLKYEMDKGVCKEVRVE